MISPYGADRKCAELTPEELEETFFYKGPNDIRLRPGVVSQRHWDVAKEVCIECPAFLACREACWGEEYGVIGGTDQYERHLYRRRRQHHVRLMATGDRAALAASIYAMKGRSAPEVIARRTGYSTGTVKNLLREHQKSLDQQAAAKAAAAQAARDALGIKPVTWPKFRPQPGDGWLFRDGEIHRGHYLAETQDGQWVRMKFRARKMPIIRWFPREHVDLRTQVTPVIAERSRGVAGVTKSDSGESAAA